MRVAVDAMGGDHAPAEIVAGAVLAYREHGTHALLVGAEEPIAEALREAGAEPGDGLEIVAAPDVVPMDDPDPARAVRSRKGSSVAVAARLLREGRADAVFSAGPTGATLAAAVLALGRIRGVARPAIAIPLPFGARPTVLLDAGANADVRPEHLASFALLGAAFAQVRIGIPEPCVGLLSVGEEAGKGNELAKAAYPLIERTGVRFIGNVEGRDIVSDEADVVVTDGFTGNVVLKLIEGLSAALLDEVRRMFDRADGAFASRLDAFEATLDPETYGGAQLLGVKGVCIIGHGNSRAQAVKAALEVASQTAEGGIIERISQHFGRRATGGSSDA